MRWSTALVLTTVLTTLAAVVAVQQPQRMILHSSSARPYKAAREAYSKAYTKLYSSVVVLEGS